MTEPPMEWPKTCPNTEWHRAECTSGEHHFNSKIIQMTMGKDGNPRFSPGKDYQGRLVLKMDDKCRETYQDMQRISLLANHILSGMELPERKVTRWRSHRNMERQTE